MRTKTLATLLTGLLSALATANCPAQTVYTPYTFTTLAGVGNQVGTNNGTGTNARFFEPRGIVLDRAGNAYVVDENAAIRRITPTAQVTTFAGVAGSFGTNDGTGNSARFRDLTGVVMDLAGNLFTVDAGSTIRKTTPAGVVTTLAGQPTIEGTNDGTGSQALFKRPFGIAADSHGNVFVSDTYNRTIRKLTPAGTNWMVTTMAGAPGVSGTNDGDGTDARFSLPSDMAMDSLGNLFVSDELAHTIRKITFAGTNCSVTTFAGVPGSVGSNDGTISDARFNNPAGLAFDAAGNLYVADSSNLTIRRISPAGVVTTLAGTPGSFGTNNGTGAAVQFKTPASITVDAQGNVYVADMDGHVVRRGFPADGAPQIFPAGPDFGFQSNSFGFLIAGPTGQSAAVEASTNLLDWQPVWTNVIGSAALPFADADSGSLPFRYYRARKP